jgi:hypothetical protein
VTPARRRIVIEALLVAALLGLGLGVRLRVAHDWSFWGSDSYGYIKLAQELRTHHRLALGPEPEPLQHYRRPIYPAFVMVTAIESDDPKAKPNHYSTMLWQILADVFLAGLLIWACARKLAGPIGGLIALALAMTCPFTVVHDCALLTEGMQMVFATVVLAILILPKKVTPWTMVAGGVAVGAAALLKPDGILLGVSFLPLLLQKDQTWKQRAMLGGVALASFLVVFAWWPLRNLRHFGDMHLATGMSDRESKNVPYYKGFWDWTTSWAHDERVSGYPSACFFDYKCIQNARMFEPLGAYESPDEITAVDKLLDERRREGITAHVERGFADLSRANWKKHPLRNFFVLPLARGMRMWTTPQTELLTNPRWLPWPNLYLRIIHYFVRWQWFYILIAALGLGLLLRREESKVGAQVLAVTLGVRTLALGWTGFVLARYAIPGYSALFILAGGVATLLPWWRDRVSRS